MCIRIVIFELDINTWFVQLLAMEGLSFGMHCPLHLLTLELSLLIIKKCFLNTWFPYSERIMYIYIDFANCELSYRLLATHFPHLCLVEDWLDEEMNEDKLTKSSIRLSSLPCTLHTVEKGQLYLIGPAFYISSSQRMPFFEGSRFCESLSKYVIRNVPSIIGRLLKNPYIISVVKKPI